jgi:hypothetical protein
MRAMGERSSFEPRRLSTFTTRTNSQHTCAVFALFQSFSHRVTSRVCDTHTHTYARLFPLIIKELLNFAALLRGAKWFGTGRSFSFEHGTRVNYYLHGSTSWSILDGSYLTPASRICVREFKRQLHVYTTSREMTHNNNDVEIYTIYCVLTAIWQTVLVSFHHSPLQLRRNMLMSRSPSLLRQN